VARVEQRLVRRIAAVERATAGPDQENALHAARKTAKRLRYATEAVMPVIGKPAARLQRRLSDVQDLLGIHQDTVVARAALRDLAVAAQAGGGNGFTYGLLHAAEAQRAADARAALPSAWRRMRRARSGRWLGL
jgi:CHAD domain-containing protein